MEVRRVTTTEEAVAALGELGDDAQILAGGTDVMLQLQRGEIHPEMLIPIEHLKDLAALSNNGTVRIGTLVTHETLAHDVLGPGFDSIRESAATVGGWQTQAVGTIGGNVCNASPAADTLPALLVHGAQVGLTSTAGERTIALGDFLKGRRQTERRADELLTHIDLEQPPPKSGDTYLKVGRRGAMEVAIVGLAMRLSFDDEGVIRQARVALASVAPIPFRSSAAESVLQGSRPDASAAASAAEALLEEISPIDDLRASARYRRLLIPGLTARATAQCADRAGIATFAEGG